LDFVLIEQLKEVRDNTWSASRFRLANLSIVILEFRQNLNKLFNVELNNVYNVTLNNTHLLSFDLELSLSLSQFRLVSTVETL